MAIPGPYRREPEEPITIFPHSYTRLPDDTDSAGAPENYRKPTKVVLLFFSFLLMAGIVSLFVSDSSPEKINPMPRGPSHGVSSKSFGPRPLLGTPAFQWTDRMLAWQRTAFHFQPEYNWMNDPNGPLHYNGKYHLFYQYNPDGAVWGNIIWGHAISADLIHWRHLPAAMVADHSYDVNGVWTGSATILSDGQIMMLYTGSTKDHVQVQNLAYPANLSDPLLMNWVKYSGNPVLVPPPGIGALDFRDPTTAMYTAEGKWRVIIGSKVNKTGMTLVYDTKDFKSFELLNGTLHDVPGTGMWECVDFYPVSETHENGLDTSVNGVGVKHVMKTSLDDTRNDHYSLGTYDEKSAKWTPENPKLDVGIGLRYDYGKFYASKTFFDGKKKRRILWGWIPESDNERADVKKGWASLQGIPRTLLFDKKTGSNLIQWPVEEVERLRLSSIEHKRVVLEPGSIMPLDAGKATQLDITAEFEIDKKALDRMNGTNVADSGSSTSCGAAAERGALGPFGFLVLADKSLSEQTPVYFYVAKGTDGNFKTLFCTDLTRSSEAPDVVKPIYGDAVPVLKGEKLSMRILVDHSIVEGFAQGGRTCITSRVYPTKAIYGNTKLFLFNNATDADITVSFKIWQMNSAYIHAYPTGPLN
ncbi:acid beta-fructofuranosidase 2, vacuolar-like [Cornus florida]|uniref:acid beta-fructofuranosidase 2, vacuolar-like n=1 Tax=Cornus florida TaxID=4283 RepID=UPI00289AB2EA|nr:acid beta-fructofuranosidase 2, vacuolar-like [Cornus florida]